MQDKKLGLIWRLCCDGPLGLALMRGSTTFTVFWCRGQRIGSSFTHIAATVVIVQLVNEYLLGKGIARNQYYGDQGQGNPHGVVRHV